MSRHHRYDGGAAAAAAAAVAVAWLPLLLSSVAGRTSHVTHSGEPQSARSELLLLLLLLLTLPLPPLLLLLPPALPKDRSHDPGRSEQPRSLKLPPPPLPLLLAAAEA